MEGFVLKSLLATASLAAFTFLPALHAGSYDNEKTTVTFPDPVEICGKTIPAGTYQFMTFPDDPEVVVVKNQAEDRVIGMFNTRQVQARFMPQRTVIRTTAGTATQPPSVLVWFYPGESLGWEFPVGK
jgi:hypothetical protein